MTDDELIGHTASTQKRVLSAHATQTQAILEGGEKVIEVRTVCVVSFGHRHDQGRHRSSDRAGRHKPTGSGAGFGMRDVDFEFDTPRTSVIDA